MSEAKRLNERSVAGGREDSEDKVGAVGLSVRMYVRYCIYTFLIDDDSVSYVINGVDMWQIGSLGSFGIISCLGWEFHYDIIDNKKIELKKDSIFYRRDDRIYLAILQFYSYEYAHYESKIKRINEYIESRKKLSDNYQNFLHTFTRYLQN